MFNALLTNTTTNNFWLDNIGVFISSAITIIGFIITYILTSKNLKDEMQKTKGNKAIELMQEVPYELLEFINNLGKISEEENLKGFNKVILTICAYGSPESVKILEGYQKEVVCKTLTDSKILFAYLGLLISQIKFDITGKIMSPESWLIIRIKDYTETRKDIVERINNLITQNNLDKRFKIEIDKND